MFFSRNSMVSCFMFKSLSHFMFIYVHGVRVFSKLFTCNCPNFPIPLAEETLFLILYSCLLCQRLSDCRCCVGLFLDFPSYFFDPYICFCVTLHHFNYCSFLILSEVLKDYASHFVFVLRVVLAILGLYGAT